MLSPERLDLMQLSWVRLLDKFGVAPADAYLLFDELVAAYEEPGRYYHNLEHLGEMLRITSRLSDFARDMPSIHLAAWYHDVIYDPKAKNNEELSAGKAAEKLSSVGIPSDVIDSIAKMILATKTHAGNDPDTRVLLDADLAILGADIKRYDRYAADIRREYSWIEDSVYRPGRIGVLESFLKRDRIYHTQRLFEMGEVPARENIKREIDGLRG